MYSKLKKKPLPAVTHIKCSLKPPFHSPSQSVCFHSSTKPSPVGVERPPSFATLETNLMTSSDGATSHDFFFSFFLSPKALTSCRLHSPLSSMPTGIVHLSKIFSNQPTEEKGGKEEKLHSLLCFSRFSWIFSFLYSHGLLRNLSKLCKCNICVCACICRDEFVFVMMLSFQFFFSSLFFSLRLTCKHYTV